MIVKMDAKEIINKFKKICIYCNLPEDIRTKGKESDGEKANVIYKALFSDVKPLKIYYDICNNRKERVLPQWNEMVGYCGQCNVDLVLIPSLSSIAFNICDVLEKISQLKKANTTIQLYFMLENIFYEDKDFVSVAAPIYLSDDYDAQKDKQRRIVAKAMDEYRAEKNKTFQVCKREITLFSELQVRDKAHIERLFDKLLDYYDDEEFEGLYGKLICYVETFDNGIGAYYRRIFRVLTEGL